jgi:predicted branched-subunit amino acid permease
MIRSMAFGEPRWLTSLDDAVARDLAGHGSVVAIIMAAVFGVIALGVFAPRSVRRAILLLAVVAALVIWVVGEGFGGLFSGPSTDPNSGPLLIVLAAAFWPLRASRVTAERPATSGAAAIAAAIVAAAAADGRG